MSSTVYIHTIQEAATAARTAIMFGYMTDSIDIWHNDRYVMNIAERLAGGDLAGREALETAIEADILRMRRLGADE